jgi:hypothetical protein
MALGVSGLMAQQRPTVNVEVSTYGQYVWRGMVVTNGPVMQTSTTAGYRGFHLNAFTNTDLNRVNQRRGKVSELDFDAGYDRSFEKATLSGGVIRYTFPNTGFPSTTEFYAGVSLAAPLRPTVRLYREVGSIDGSYASFDTSHGFALPKPHPKVTWGAELSAGLGVASSCYNKGYFGVDRAGFADFHPALALPFGFGTHVRITPRAGYASVLDSALRQSATVKPHNFFVGVSLSLAY